ncbi:PucR family transcriptional regulator [Microbacterium sp.]|uniref:PucR family transcriptional regulator n=1 Tax=Microbacterium sp. TaxID=51671 RepID=UPI003A8B18E8
MNLDGAVQALADRIGRPIIVFDADFAVAAFSVHEADVDSARLAMILSRKSSTRAMRMIREHRVQHSTGAVLLPPVDGTPPRVVASLRFDGLITGYLSYVPRDDETADERESPAVAIGRDELGAMLAARQAGVSRRAERTDRLVADLLDGDLAQRQSAAEDLARLGLVGTADGYAVLLARSTQTGRTSGLALRKTLTSILAECASRSAGAMIEGQAVAVVADSVATGRLRELCRTDDFSTVHVGVGPSVPVLTDAAVSRHRAQIAMDATVLDPTQYSRIAFWDELGIDRLLLQLPLTQLTVADLPEPVRRLLREASNADFVRTLEAYLDNGGDAQRTAGHLHIHRSTLYYRLDRVRELIHVDLADGIVRRELHTALRIARLAGLS